MSKVLVARAAHLHWESTEDWDEDAPVMRYGTDAEAAMGDAILAKLTTAGG